MGRKCNNCYDKTAECKCTECYERYLCSDCKTYHKHAIKRINSNIFKSFKNLVNIKN